MSGKVFDRGEELRTGNGGLVELEERDRRGTARVRERPARDHRSDAAPAGGFLRREVAGADLAGVAEIRHALRRLMACRPGARGESVADVAALLSSELLTNALVHTGGGAVVTAAVAGRRLRVEVRDADACLPVVREASPAGTSGRGMLLVDHLADAWGVCADGHGKCVWFELDVESAR